MSRMTTTGDEIPVQATNDVYTALVVIAVVAEIVALVLLFFRHDAVFGTGLFSA